MVTFYVEEARGKLRGPFPYSLFLVCRLIRTEVEKKTRITLSTIAAIRAEEIVNESDRIDRAGLKIQYHNKS